MRFDLSHLALSGAPAPIIEGVGRGAPATGATQAAVSETGTLAYVPGPAAMASGGRTLGVFSNDAAPTALPVQTDSYEFPRMSPDFGRIAVGVNTGTEAAIYIYPMSGKADRQRLTVGGVTVFLCGHMTAVGFSFNPIAAAIAPSGGKPRTGAERPSG